MKLVISEADLSKIEKRKAKEAKSKVNEEWLFMAEFGYYFGWEGIKAIREDEYFTRDEADMLLKGARKVWNAKVYDHAWASLVGTASANSKKPSKEFKKSTTELIKNTKADA